MSKRPASDNAMGKSDRKKRKHLTLSIEQKVILLRKLDSGVNAKLLAKEFGVGTTTVYDLKKQKDKLFKFYGESDEPKLMKNRKTLHKAKNEDLDCVMKEWVRQHRSEHVPLTSQMIMDQAKVYHKELKIEGNCEYSTGWFQKFKKRHGIKFLKVCGDKASADHEAAEKYFEEFAEIIAEENLTTEQVYNADEAALLWRYCPRKTPTKADETVSTGIKDAKDRLMVLKCTNTEGIHKCKPIVVGKSLHPCCFKNRQTDDFLSHAKAVPSETVKKLENVGIKEIFNIDNEAPVIHSITNGEIAKNQGDCGGSDYEDETVKTAVKMPISEMLKKCDELIGGLEQCEFITEQEIMSIYKLKERLLKENTLVMRQVTQQEVLKKAIQHDVYFSSLEDPVLGPSTSCNVPAQHGDEVAKRWKALRDRFAREKRLTDASKKWRFFSQLTFLSDHIKCKRTSSNAFDSVDNTSDLEVGTPSGNGADNCDAAQSINLEHPSAGANPREDMSECSSPSLHTSGPPPKRQRRTMNIDIINTLRNVSQALKSNLYNHAKPLETMDGEMAFGIAVSHRLKRLTPKQSSLAQFRIQQLLYEVEFGE